MESLKYNIALTGVPRSGTTLTCHLLNKVHNTVALHEPMDVFELPRLKDDETRIKTIKTFFENTRNSLLTKGTALTKHHNQKIPDNPIASEKEGIQPRKSIVERSEIPISKPLNTNFYLIIKHPGAFTALLSYLQPEFACFAVIRNPISVLASWNSVDLLVNQGHAPIAEQLNPKLTQALNQKEDKIERQLFLLSWFFEQYATYLPAQAILRYEETVATQGKSLKVVVPAAENLNEDLHSKNKNPLYNPEEMKQLGKRLLASSGAYWNFYSKESVETLLNQY